MLAVTATAVRIIALNTTVHERPLNCSTLSLSLSLSHSVVSAVKHDSNLTG